MALNDTRRRTIIRVPVGVCFLRPTLQSSTSAMLQPDRHCSRTCVSSSVFGSADCSDDAQPNNICITYHIQFLFNMPSLQQATIGQKTKEKIISYAQ